MTRRTPDGPREGSLTRQSLGTHSGRQALALILATLRLADLNREASLAEASREAEAN